MERDAIVLGKKKRVEVTETIVVTNERVMVKRLEK
jgi:hypothetical protein